MFDVRFDYRKYRNFFIHKDFFVNTDVVNIHSERAMAMNETCIFLRSTITCSLMQGLKTLKSPSNNAFI